MQDLFNENNIKLLRETKEKLNKWRNIPHLWVARLNTVKMPFTPRCIYRLNEILLIIPAAFFFFFFGRNQQGDSKIYMEVQITSNSQAILKQD